jgi:hypothetical protein
MPLKTGSHQKGSTWKDNTEMDLKNTVWEDSTLRTFCKRPILPRYITYPADISKSKVSPHIRKISASIMKPQINIKAQNDKNIFKTLNYAIFITCAFTNTTGVWWRLCQKAFIRYCHRTWELWLYYLPKLTTTILWRILWRVHLLSCSWLYAMIEFYVLLFGN